MSATVPAEIRCPGCDTAFTIELFTNLHVTRSPERRDAILAGKFSVFDCPGCAVRVRIEPTMLYTDFEQWKWYAVFPRSAIVHRSALAVRVDAGFHHNLEVAAPPMVRDWAPNMERRLFFGLAALRDKLLCDDASGIDDRAVEALKWLVLRSSAPTAIHPEAAVHLDAIEHDRLVLRIEPLPGPDGTVVVRTMGVARSRLDDPETLRVADLLFGASTSTVDWRATLWPDLPLADPIGEPRVRTPWMPA